MVWVDVVSLERWLRTTLPDLTRALSPHPVLVRVSVYVLRASAGRCRSSDASRRPTEDSPTPLPTLERQSAVEDTTDAEQPEPEPEPEQPERRQVGFVSDGTEADDEEPVERHTRLHRCDPPHHLKNKRIVTNKVSGATLLLSRGGGSVIMESCQCVLLFPDV